MTSRYEKVRVSKKPAQNEENKTINKVILLNSSANIACYYYGDIAFDQRSFIVTLLTSIGLKNELMADVTCSQ